MITRLMFTRPLRCALLALALVAIGLTEVRAMDLHQSSPPWGQQAHIAATENLSRADAAEFLKWVDAKINEADTSKVLSIELVQVVLARVDAGAFILPGNIRSTANTIRQSQFESADKKNALSPDVCAAWTYAFLNAVYTKARLPALRVAAGEQLADLLEKHTLNNEGMVVRKKLVEECQVAELEFMNLLQSNRLDTAGRLFQQKKVAEAEVILLEVTSYPWYLLKGGDDVQRFRDYYVRGMMGLIDSRRGKLQALKDIVIVPACAEKIQPYLTSVIKLAEEGR